VDPFLYTFLITVHPRRKGEEVMAAFDSEIRRIMDDIPPVDEIKRAIKQARALFAYSSENITSQASWLGYAGMFSDYAWFMTYLDRLEKVTPAQVQQAARSYLKSQNRVVGVYAPAIAKVNP
jgi:zinc protease